MVPTNFIQDNQTWEAADTGSKNKEEQNFCCIFKVGGKRITESLNINKEDRDLLWGRQNAKTYTNNYHLDMTD